MEARAHKNRVKFTVSTKNSNMYWTAMCRHESLLLSWNMNARHCRVAQTGGQRENIVGSWPLISSFLQAVTNVIRLLLTLCTVLSVVLQTRPPEWVVQCEGVKEIVEGLVPYTERHFQRLSRLLQVSSTWLKDYTMQLVCYSRHVYFLYSSLCLWTILGSV